ncbi:MAG: endonuclease/exonuclease/phosphatase family protein [Spirochaetaceae bacterium]
MKKRFKKTSYFIENHTESNIQLSNTIKLLNWNIQKRNSHNKWQDEFKNLIEEYEPSIILLQECQFKKGLEYLLNFEHYGFVFAPNFIDLFKNHHSGVLSASLSNYNSVNVIHSHAYEPFIKIPKIFLSTTYSIDNKTLLVINIHAINFVGFWKFISQVQQLESTIKSFSGPVILSGDFNTWNKKRTKILDIILTNIGLKKVNFPLEHQKHVKKFMFIHPLDHIYYRNLKVEKEPYVLKTKNSDHNPLIVTFKLDL